MLDLDTIFDPDRKPAVSIQAVAITPADLPADWHFLWDERAAIMEYDGGMTTERAEAESLKDICRLMRESEMRGIAT